jgi:hypothetical protein
MCVCALCGGGAPGEQEGEGENGKAGKRAGVNDVNGILARVSFARIELRAFFLKK